MRRLEGAVYRRRTAGAGRRRTRYGQDGDVGAVRAHGDRGAGACTCGLGRKRIRGKQVLISGDMLSVRRWDVLSVPQCFSANDGWNLSP